MNHSISVINQETRPTILLVEDEQAIADTALFALQREGYLTQHVLLGKHALQQLQNGGIDLVILDIGLPDISGFDICRNLRQFTDIPVIFLSARHEEIDRILGLELGADDYITKPFSPRELVARVRARLRRHTISPNNNSTNSEINNSSVEIPPVEPHITIGVFLINKEGHRIYYNDELLNLTRFEYSILNALLQRPNAILTREQLLQHHWDYTSETTDRTVDTHIKALRTKLKLAGAKKDPICTHRGLGYSILIEN